MTTPGDHGTPAEGWYPDPSADGRLRYWDGRAWTDHVRWAPGGQTPPEPGAGAPAGGRRDPARATHRGLAPLLLVAALLLGIGLVALVLRPSLTSPGSEDSSSPTQSAWDERSSSPPSSAAVPRECPTQPAGRPGRPRDGRLHGGGLVVSVPAGFAPGGQGFGWMLADPVASTKRAPGTIWSSFTQVGRLPRGAFPDLSMAPRQVIECHTSSPNFPERGAVTTVVDEPGRLGRAPTRRVRQEVASGRAPGGGAVFDAIVVDLGDPQWWGVYWSGVVIADGQALTAVDAVRRTLARDA